jgi:hypothetical protein
MRPRRQRWISMPDVLGALPEYHPAFWVKIANKDRKRQLEAVRRLVGSVERRDSVSYTKRAGGDIFVKRSCLALLVSSKEIGQRDPGVEFLEAELKRLRATVKAQGSIIRSQALRLAEIERKLLS